MREKIFKADSRYKFKENCFPMNKKGLLECPGSMKYSNVAIMAFLCFLMWMRQANSSIIVSLGYPIFISHLVFTGSIIVAFILFAGNALRIVKTTRTLRQLFFLLLVYVTWLYLSNNMADLAVPQSNNWGTFDIQFYDWIISLIIIFISIGVLDKIIFNFQGKRFLLCLLIFISISSVLLFYLFIISIAGVLSGDSESQDLFSGGNKMIIGKIFFVNMLLMTACLRFRISNKPLYKFLLICGHLVIAIFIVVISVRTALLSWIVLLFLVMLIDSKKYSARWIFLNSGFILGVSLFVVLICFSLLLAAMVSIGYSPNIFFNLESSPLKLLDDILSGRYASALFGISFFMQSFNENIYHAVIGFGNEWSNFLYKKYYMQMIGVTFPTIDLSYFQQGDYYSPHNSFVDILISNGLIGFLLFVSIIMFILLTLRNMIENNNLSLVKKYLMLAILVIIVGFFCTDNDFLGGRIILNTFFILFVTSVLVNKHNLPARITG